MESHDETGARRASDRAADDVGHSRPAGPSQPDSGYAEGIEHRPDGPDEPEPDFARGERTTPDDEPETQGNFAKGAEQLPDSPDKHVERRFSEGIERKPRTD